MRQDGIRFCKASGILEFKANKNESHGECVASWFQWWLPSPRYQNEFSDILAYVYKLKS